MGSNTELPTTADQDHSNRAHRLSQFHNRSNFSADPSTSPFAPEVEKHKKLSAESSAANSVIPENAILEDSGRTYHVHEQGKYFLPNDPTEQDRLDLQHATIMKLLGRLSLAPMSQTPHYVLDIATGTGIWALDFAEENPTSYVIGTDLSPIQPKHRNLTNCEFIVEDSEKDWVFPGIKFDYIHLRMTFTCFDDPKRVVHLAYENLSPGGWIEYHDSIFLPGRMGGTAEGTALQRWCDLCIRGAAIARGRDISSTPHLKDWLIEAGYEEVTEKKYLWPISPWPRDPQMKEVGLYNMSNMLDGFRGAGWKMLQATGLSALEIEELTEEVKKEVQDTSNRFYFTVYVIYGRKPFASEGGSQDRPEVKKEELE